MPIIRIKRVYEPREDRDGYRILVDRLWPRGVAKTEASWDEWLKELAPSEELRKWYGHDPIKWGEFKRRYFEELKSKQEELRRMRTAVESHQTVTLIFAAKDIDRSNAAALREFLEKS